MIEFWNNPALRRMNLSITTVIWLLALTATVGAYPLSQCAGERHGSNLGCTANDVSITGINIAPGGPTSCVGGSTVTLALDVTLNFAVPDRYDIGVFLANDGKDPSSIPSSGGSSSCTVSVLPLTSPFLNLDGLDRGNPTGDTCGDGNGTIGGGTRQGVLRINTVPVSCQAVDLSGGKLFIPFLTSWDNGATPPGPVCTSAADPAPNTSSKCNVPDGTVLADVLKSTVDLVVLPNITKTDGLVSLTAGDSTTYTVVITNTTGATLRNAIFRDPTVANLTVDSLSCVAAGGASCPASTAISTMQGGGITIPDMPANSSVTFTIGATVESATPAGTITNTAQIIVSGKTNSANDTNNIVTKFAVSKSFLPASISAGGTSLLTIMLQNTNLSGATGVAFTDIYPANLVNAAVPGVTNTCGGTATAGAASLALSNGTIPAGGSCAITVNVTSIVAGAYTNSSGPVTSMEGYTGNPASASLAVGVSNLSTSTKAWQNLNGGEPDPGETIQYTLTLTETAGTTATGVSIADTITTALTGLTVITCPPGATCTLSGQTLTATNITVPANSFVTLVFNGTIAGGSTAGSTINNCAAISNLTGLGAAPCASTLTVSPSAVAGSGNKWLYLFDGTTISRSKPAGTPATVTISKGGSQLWTLNPVLASSLTISPAVTPLAIIPVNLFLASNTASESRTVQVDVTCSGGGATYSETKIFDGTAVNNPYLPTTPTLVAFNNLTLSADHLCAAGQTWNLTVRNTTTGTGTRNVTVYPVSGGNNSYLSLPSQNIINVDSINSYNAAYSAVTTPANGYFGGGQTIYIRAVVSDPFGNFDINSATVTIKNPYDTTVLSAAPMSLVATPGSATKIFEYQYTVPTSGPAGIWSTIVTAQEGTEGTISDSGTGIFKLGLPSLLIVKSAQTYSDPINGTSSPRAIPGSFVTYTIQVINSGHGAVDADTTILTDPIPANTELFVGDIDGIGPATGPVLFSDGATASGLNYTFTNLNSSTDNLAFSDNNATNYNKINTAPDSNECDPSVTNIKIPLSGIFNGSDGVNHPSFNVKFKVRIK